MDLINAKFCVYYTQMSKNVKKILGVIDYTTE
jgi:hypothetical protein